MDTMYLIDYKVNTKPANRLHKDARDLLKKYDRLIVCASEIERLKEEINENVAALNHKHNRCLPMNPVHLFDFYDDWRMSLNSDMFVLKLCKINGRCY